MGINGVVQCNCYRDGLTPPFPLPGQESRYQRDQDGWMELHLPDSTDFEAMRAFHTWRETACRHRSGVHTHERLGSTGHLLNALERAGPAYSALWALIPQGCGLFTQPAKVPSFLSELRRFRAERAREWVVLVDSESGLQAYYGAWPEGEIHWECPETKAGLDSNGFFWLDASGVERFRARRFEQRALSSDWSLLAWTDLDSGATWQADFPCLLESPHPARKFEVKIGDDGLDRILDSIGRLLLASTETGNPIMWT